MSNAAQVIDLVHPTSAAETAFTEMRALFGRNRAASRWSNLQTSVRALVCRAAGLPDEGRFLELDQFEMEQQEAIRLTLRDLLPILKAFNEAGLERSEWYRTNRPSSTQRKQVAPANAPPEPVSRDDLLANRKALLKKINGQSGQLPEPQALYDEE